MTIYFIFIFYFLIAGKFYDLLDQKLKIFFNLINIVFLTLIFGLRNDVGADWHNYVNVYNNYIYDSFVFNKVEFGYKAVNVLSHKLDLGINGVIFSCTLLFFLVSIFSISIAKLNPYYFLAIVAPYHLVMSGMNYTRQSVALSFVLLSFVYYLQENKNKTFLSVFFAVSFHKSAIIFILLGVLHLPKKYLVPIGITLLFGVLSFMIDDYVDRYLESSRYDSSGFFLRFGFIIVCCILLFNQFRYYKILTVQVQRAVNLMYCSFFLLLPISFVSSTSADRLAYYFVLLGALLVSILSLQNSSIKKISISNYSSLLLFLCSFVVFLVWVFFGTMSSYYEFNHLLFS